MSAQLSYKRSRAPKEACTDATFEFAACLARLQVDRLQVSREHMRPSVDSEVHYNYHQLSGHLVSGQA